MEDAGNILSRGPGNDPRIPLDAFNVKLFEATKMVEYLGNAFQLMRNNID